MGHHGAPTYPGAGRRAGLCLHGIAHTQLLKRILDRVDEVGGGALLQLAKEADCPSSTAPALPDRSPWIPATGLVQGSQPQPPSRQLPNGPVARSFDAVFVPLHVSAEVADHDRVAVDAVDLAVLHRPTVPPERGVGMRVEPRLSRALPPGRCGLTVHGGLRLVPDEGGPRDRQGGLGVERTHSALRRRTAPPGLRATDVQSGGSPTRPCMGSDVGGRQSPGVLPNPCRSSWPERIAREDVAGVGHRLLVDDVDAATSGV